MTVFKEASSQGLANNSGTEHPDFHSYTHASVIRDAHGQWLDSLREHEKRPKAHLESWDAL